MITIRIDGKSIETAPGKSVLEVALDSRIYIPHLCHDPDLKPAGHCRLCIVEIEGRGVVASCQVRVEEGMRVQTESSLLSRTRKATLELLLAEHAGDCLRCSKVGRCKLQEAASYIGLDSSPLPAAVALEPCDESNPFFNRDPNRCVLCGICVRTCQEVQGAHALDFFSSGALTRIDTAGGLPITASACESCGECVIRCPTGALAEKESLIPAAEVQTTCTYCGVGCGLFLGVRGDRVVSARGDRSSPVNRGQLCVKGRYGFSFINSPERLKTPLIRKDGVLRPASWDEALDYVADKFKQYRGDPFGAISSSRATNEENYLMQKFARAVMGTNNVDNCARLCHAPTVSGLSKAFGTGGGTNPLDDLEHTECILVVGSNTTEAHPVAGAKIRRAAMRAEGRAKLIVIDPREISLCRIADLWLQIRPGTDVALLQGISKLILDEGLADEKFLSARCEGLEDFRAALQKFDLESVEKITGVPKEKIRAAARMYASSKSAVTVYSLGITEHSHGTDNVLAIANLAMITGNVGKRYAGVMPMRGQNNVQGACDMGCIPGSFPGSQSVQKPDFREKFERAWQTKLPVAPGITILEMLEAASERKLKALYIMGMDVAFSVADTQRTQAALRSAEFIVVQDLFLTGTAQFADVVLPAASFAEKCGTFTNLERRVQMVRKAIEPVGESRPDWLIICELARRMNARGFDYADSSEIMTELASLAPPFAGLSFERLENGGIQWPCSDSRHPGTSRLHVQCFNTPSGKGKLSALTFRPPAESPDQEFPFLLTTGRSLYHFHLAMTSQVRGLMELFPEELAWLHPDDAQTLGIKDADYVKVTSRRGQLTVRAKIAPAMARGSVFMTFHFYDKPTNVLTSQAFDPVSKTPEFKVTAVKLEKAIATD
ncbi:MAG: formate dehydrogenase subunit alpha [Bdellovibrionales bacterium RIFOXYC1_FULL_54_43]|nr:MAG: formate dehydrogenase subunit alpha [Bdellovibrionales bacterium RIFOXYC1_FULL_54_43]OFZ85020.1 MAG: formate dehydrogenase subunit alpha [Bdellovibrionales bacterium RIFOXYD1_FULL_55_31]